MAGENCLFLALKITALCTICLIAAGCNKIDHNNSNNHRSSAHSWIYQGAEEWNRRLSDAPDRHQDGFEYFFSFYENIKNIDNSIKLEEQAYITEVVNSIRIIADCVEWSGALRYDGGAIRGGGWLPSEMAKSDGSMSINRLGMATVLRACMVVAKNMEESQMSSDYGQFGRDLVALSNRIGIGAKSDDKYTLRMQATLASMGCHLLSLEAFHKGNATAGREYQEISKKIISMAK